MWKPANATDASRLPVIVYLHGGGNYYNSAQGFPMNEWVTRSEGAVVAVSIQYVRPSRASRSLAATLT